MARVDLYALYGVDARTMLRSDDCDCELITGLLIRLQHEPRSQYRAEALGGPEWFGYSRELAALGDIADYTLWAGQAGAMNKVKFKPRYPRPELKHEKPVLSVRDLSFTPGVTRIRQ